ncbi:uncharacterized protein LOC135132676 [Zophobas morio]|uniref:uncharacterized protein LOC135132676 n=1 Tax=Zophobas morio TaxID=2755281 RepID=UPI0030830784
MKLATLVSLVLLAYCIAENPVDYRIPLSTSCTPRECTSPGPLCETCTSLVGCVDIGNGTYNKTQLGNCKPPSYCVVDVCDSNPDPFCSGVTELPFECHQVGVFPHQFYHNKFVYCYKDGANFKSILNECEDGYTFNVANDLCSEHAENAECPHAPYPVPLCNRTAQSGAIEKKPAMYYICKERVVNSSKTFLYPDLYLCPGAETYVDFTCS